MKAAQAVKTYISKFKQTLLLPINPNMRLIFIPIKNRQLGLGGIEVAQPCWV